MTGPAPIPAPATTHILCFWPHTKIFRNQRRFLAKQPQIIGWVMDDDEGRSFGPGAYCAASLKWLVSRAATVQVWSGPATPAGEQEIYKRVRDAYARGQTPVTVNTHSVHESAWLDELNRLRRPEVRLVCVREGGL